MSFFENIVQSALGAAVNAAQSQEQTSSVMTGALNMLQNMGGVEGLVSKLQQSGLGDLAASWVGSGENKAISAEQLQSVLGSQQIAALAAQAGIPESKGAGMLAEFLPALVDKLTPDGTAPQASQLGTFGKVLLGGAAAAVAAKAAASFFGNDNDEQPLPTAAEPAAETGFAPPAPAATESARVYTVASGDSLYKIAKQFYGDGNQWHKIFEANQDILRDPNLINPGQTLRIP